MRTFILGLQFCQTPEELDPQLTNLGIEVNDCGAYRTIELSTEQFWLLHEYFDIYLTKFSNREFSICRLTKTTK